MCVYIHMYTYIHTLIIFSHGGKMFSCCSLDALSEMLQLSLEFSGYRGKTEVFKEHNSYKHNWGLQATAQGSSRWNRHLDGLPQAHRLALAGWTPAVTFPPVNNRKAAAGLGAVPSSTQISCHIMRCQQVICVI